MMLYPNSATQNKEDIKKQFQTRLKRNPATISIFDTEPKSSENQSEVYNETDKLDDSLNNNKPEKVILFRNSNFTLKGCITSFILLVIIFFAFVYFLTTQIPSFKTQVDNFLNSQVTPQLNKTLNNINIPIVSNLLNSKSSSSKSDLQNKYLLLFQKKISDLNNSSGQLQTISLTQDEINAWLSNQTFELNSQKINSYVIIDPTNLKLNLNSGILPQVSLFIGTNSDKKLRLNGGSIGGTTLSIADFRDKLATLPLGIGNYNFDKLNEQFSSLLFNNNWIINSVILKNQEVEIVVTK